MAPQTMEFYNLTVTISGLLAIVMQIGQVVQMTEKVLQEVVSSLGTI
jgi:hypothetical protein